MQFALHPLQPVLASNQTSHLSLQGASCMRTPEKRIVLEPRSWLPKTLHARISDFRDGRSSGSGLTTWRDNHRLRLSVHRSVRNFGEPTANPNSQADSSFESSRTHHAANLALRAGTSTNIYNTSILFHNELPKHLDQSRTSPQKSRTRRATPPFLRFLQTLWQKSFSKIAPKEQRPLGMVSRTFL